MTATSARRGLIIDYNLIQGLEYCNVNLAVNLVSFQRIVTISFKLEVFDQNLETRHSLSEWSTMLPSQDNCSQSVYQSFSKRKGFLFTGNKILPKGPRSLIAEL